MQALYLELADRFQEIRLQPALIVSFVGLCLV
jgi:hypothetical protein